MGERSDVLRPRVGHASRESNPGPHVRPPPLTGAITERLRSERLACWSREGESNSHGLERPRGLGPLRLPLRHSSHAPRGSPIRCAGERTRTSRPRRLKGARSATLSYAGVEDGAGFEPAEDFLVLGGLAHRRHKPLGHPSFFIGAAEGTRTPVAYMARRHPCC
jgi:hypothetical protein